MTTLDTGDPMHRTLRIAALGFALTAATLAVPTAALAAPTPAAGEISALADNTPLGGNPWSPGATTHVNVHNGGETAAKGYFLVTLPKGTELGATDICEPATPGDALNWVCGGDEVPAGGNKDYLIRVNSILDEPAFGTSALGYVTGRTADGQLGNRKDFLISWPEKMPLRLAVKAGKTVDGKTQVKVKATNAGTFAIGGYTLDIHTPDNVTVDDSCGPVPALDGIGCRVTRQKTLAAGATDTFTVTVTVQGGKTPVGFVLTPAQRYTNKDTKATLKLAGDEATESPAPAPADPEENNGGSGGGGSLPVTGIDGGTLLIGGTGLVAVGALLLGVTRRRRVTLG
ncbi:hypothetical protein [Actinoplanes sp. NPDC049599]|uniref:hypothetical protein n=1 Tax=Actinoplanes sp. NPDC049599 TaxID=3363903 RepID=UPI003799E7A5